jgi:hypothetical protein
MRGKLMRKIGSFALLLVSAIWPQASMAGGGDVMDDAQRWAYEQCAYGQWAELGYSYFSECTHYKVEEYLINH